MTTSIAKAHRILHLQGQLQSHEALLHTAQNAGERRYFQDRVDEFRRDLERLYNEPVRD